MTQFHYTNVIFKQMEKFNILHKIGTILKDVKSIEKLF